MSQFPSGIQSRLRHPSGANVDNPRPSIDLTLKFIDGQWSIWRYHQVHREVRKVADVPHEVAQVITAAAGTITADVVASNYAKWTEAFEIAERDRHRREVQKSEARLLEAQRARTSARSAA